MGAGVEECGVDYYTYMVTLHNVVVGGRECPRRSTKNTGPSGEEANGTLTTNYSEVQKSKLT